jgi:hypothetical protein
MADPDVLRELTAKYVLRFVPSEDLPVQAVALLVAGYESPSLGALAGAAQNEHPADLRDLFERALREIGASLPDRRSAGEFLKRHWAGQVVSRTLSPREGALGIVNVFRELEHDLPKPERFVGDSFGVAEIVGLFYAFDDVAPTDEPAIEKIEQHLRSALAKLAEEKPT